jgi:hypothetical protein
MRSLGAFSGSGSFLRRDTCKNHSVVIGECADLRDKMSAHKTEVALLAKDTEAERTSAARLRDEPAKAATTWEPTSLSVSAELAAKNAEITQREESIGILEADIDRLIDIVAAKDQANLALGAELAAKNSEIAQREERIGLLENEVTRLNQSRRTVRWLARGLWAWITLKPGTRPRRAARKAVIVLAGYVSARPRLVALAKPLLALVPSLNARLRVAVYSDKVVQLPTSEMDISAEPESVQQLYRRLIQARKYPVEDH